MNAETWNERYPVGTPVVAYPGTRDGKRLKTRTRSKAWELFSGDSVVKVHGRAGGIALTHIDIDAATAAADEAFTLHAREDVAVLLAEVARLREFERRVTEELEEFEDAAKADPNTPRVARLMIAALQHAVKGGA